MELVCKFGEESWTITVVPLNINIKDGFYELMISTDTSQLHLIIGKHAYGDFLCIPSLCLSCQLDSIYDSFWNRIRFRCFLSDRDVETIVCVLSSFMPFVRCDYVECNY